MYAEVKALAQGLQFSVTRGYYNVDIEVNSKVLVLMVQKRGSTPWSVLYEMKRIQELQCKLDYSISHVYRVANSAAD